jgi:hypothetical protein
MTLFMSHDCPKCGGELLIDTDKLIYSCDFCGMTFDFDYFETANLLSVANRALGRGEFNAARKMFEELSEKDPHDAAVLRGLLFCDEKIESLYSLDIEDFPIDTEGKHFTYSIEHADHIGLQYFGHIKNAAEISKKYQESVKEDQICQKECNDIGSKILDKTGQIDAYRHSMTNAYQVTSSMAKSDDNISDLIGLVIVLLFFFAAVGIRIGVEYFGLPFLFLSLAVIIACVLIYKAFKANKIAKMKKDLAALMNKEKELRRKLDESKAKSDKIQDGYIAEIQEAMNLEKTMFGEVER